MVVFIKARLVVEGNVQAVGYRALIKQIARSIGLKGKVRNLDDGRVEIYCEGDKNSILKLQKQINIQSDEPENVFAVAVEKIHRYFEHETGYPDLGEKFGFFEIDYGDEAKSPFEKANLEKLEIGSLMMLGLGKKMGSVGSEVKSLGTGVKSLGTGVREGFSTTHDDFMMLDGKYDAVSTELKSIKDKISNMNGNISKLVDHLGTIIDQFIEDRSKKENQS